MGLIFSGAVGLLRKVPVWVWVVAAALAWGAWQRHLAHSAADKLLTLQRQVAAAQEKALTESLEQYASRVLAQQKELTDANTKLADAQRSARSAADAAAGLRAHLALRSSASPNGAPTACDGKADLTSDLLGACAERYAGVAAEADRAILSGLLCERLYDSLRPPK